MTRCSLVDTNVLTTPRLETLFAFLNASLFRSNKSFSVERLSLREEESLIGLERSIRGSSVYEARKVVVRRNE